MMALLSPGEAGLLSEPLKETSLRVNALYDAA
jgi:hypothetical protein